MKLWKILNLIHYHLSAATGRVTRESNTAVDIEIITDLSALTKHKEDRMQFPQF